MKRFQVLYAGGFAEVVEGADPLDALAKSIEELQTDNNDFAALAISPFGTVVVRVFELEL